MVRFVKNRLSSGVKTIIVRQAGQEGCGLAALRTLLVNLSHNQNYRYLTLEGHPPYSLAQLRDTAQKEGLKLEFRRAVETSAIRKADKFPLLAVLKTSTGADHMVIVSGLKNGKLIVLDSSEGKKLIPYEDFEAVWTCIYGEVVSYEPKVCSFHKPSIVPTWPLAIQIIIELISDGALLCGFYFMDGSGSFIYPVTFFMIFALSAVLRRVLGTYFLKKFDLKWLGSIYDKNPSHFRTNYEHYHQFKGFLFVSPFDCCSALFLLLALAFLIGVNNPSFFIALGAIGVYEGLASLLFSRRLRKRRKVLAETEESLFSGRLDEKETFLRLDSLNKETYDIADGIGNFRVVFYALCLALTFLCFIGQNSVSLNFYLFHFFGLITAGDSFERCFSYLLSMPLREEETEYFREYFAKKSVSE